MATAQFKRPTEQKWTQLRMEYVRSDMSLRELHKKYSDVASFNGIASRSKREKWLGQRRLYQLEKSQEIEQQSVDLATDGITVEAQAECRKAYITDANSIMGRVRAVLTKTDGLSPIDLQRLATTCRTCQQIEFASLRIPIDAIDVNERVTDGSMSWLDRMIELRGQKGLSKDTP